MHSAGVIGPVQGQELEPNDPGGFFPAQEILWNNNRKSLQVNLSLK